MKLSKDEVSARVREAAFFCGVSEDLFERSPLELSGGQKRRVAIAGVIAMPETPSCASRKNGTCTFTITQFICVEIPVYFGANASSRDAYVTCLGATSEDICTECGVAHDGTL